MNYLVFLLFKKENLDDNKTAIDVSRHLCPAMLAPVLAPTVCGWGCVVKVVTLTHFQGDIHYPLS